MTICPSTDIHRTTSLVRRVARGLRDDADLRDQAQEIESILPREILPVKADSGKLSKPTFLSSRSYAASCIARTSSKTRLKSGRGARHMAR